MKEKFLTVMAVLDCSAQNVMAEMQAEFISRFGEGAQTMGIPFHISLGSFAPDKAEEIAERVTAAAEKLSPFEVEFDGSGHFGGKVIFLQPKVCEPLAELHRLFEGSYADGFPWHAHATVYICGEGQTIDIARCGFAKVDKLKKATITGIELSEFFPPRRIVSVPLGGSANE